MSASSGVGGFCKFPSCLHANNEHSYYTCKEPGCKSKWKICQMGSHATSKWALCKTCVDHPGGAKCRFRTTGLIEGLFYAKSSNHASTMACSTAGELVSLQDDSSHELSSKESQSGVNINFSVGGYPSTRSQPKMLRVANSEKYS